MIANVYRYGNKPHGKDAIRSFRHPGSCLHVGDTSALDGNPILSDMLIPLTPVTPRPSLPDGKTGVPKDFERVP